MELNSANILVTGAASGLGEAVARYLVTRGARVLLADLNSDAGHALAQELGESAFFVTTDITREDEARHAIETLRERWGDLHGLVNCAGIPGAARVLGREGVHDLERFSRAIGVNLIGTFNMIRLAAEAMQHTQPNDQLEQGVIINTASVAAYDGQIGQAAYAASKGGIVSMTLPIARELANFGIRVMTIAPGLFKTPMMGALPEEVQQSLGESVPFPARLGEPSEFALLVGQIFDNPMLNGEVIRLDGALRMAAR
ncbi:3-hydroxy-2-methylbutyryl-CoA dehydrogenase [Saccharospirillum sp. MSK14-1]|uniref:3-hydroxyacyl-CoA dehydrogenase n=1 Tax=Saccharospirillum sp. MSK14-1 TaxID=1897632 RepID=UPI000D395D29|nr:3-hydroxyacyl-CoA dehydrogenase [Saccharospirillum sp. MSK14-1]PTY37863.1 3-hydroxy-2-methylbutyryl-CoA dehydrogenase [Saccharospirillum sp. MSK14-1]